MQPDTLRAAGLMLQTSAGAVLFCKRADTGEWAFPGGRIEDGEDALACAIREVAEETGLAYDGEAVELARRNKDGVDFTTFLAPTDEFAPTLDAEHTGYAWAMPSEPPQPIHPGAAAAIAMLDPNELDVARLISSGDLTSPQFFRNMHLFAIRITGTGTAYRSKGEEFAWRDPSIYLNPEFLARCNGLPVIFEHPKDATLDSDEFSDRVVGSIMLPYIQGDEVWGIARIYDEDTATLMRDEQVSTSPCVALKAGDSSTVTLDDGRKVLIEGAAALIDHIAICAQGVWDKGGPPSGVLSSGIGDQNMPKEIVKADEAEDKREEDKADADPMSVLADSVKSLMARMDAMDADKAAKADADDKDEEAKKADEDEKKEEEKADEDCDADKKADAGAAESAELRRQIADLDRRVPKILTDAELDAVSTAQARADSVASMVGEAAPRPMQGESALSYRRRLASKYRTHSTRWSGVDLAKADDAFLTIAEEDIYSAMRKAAEAPATVQEGRLRAIVRADSTGMRQITTFVGEPHTWMQAFKAPRMTAVKFNTERA